MKITDLSIVFVLIFSPIFWVISHNTNSAQEAQYLSDRYKMALQSAVLDAGAVMHQNEKQNDEAGYDSTKFVKADKELALATFTQTMALNMGILNDPAAIRAMFNYIPALVVLDYDGYYIFAIETEMTGKLEESFRQVWSPKSPIHILIQMVTVLISHSMGMCMPMTQVWASGWRVSRKNWPPARKSPCFRMPRRLSRSDEAGS